MSPGKPQRNKGDSNLAFERFCREADVPLTDPDEPDCANPNTDFGRFDRFFRAAFFLNNDESFTYFRSKALETLPAHLTKAQRISHFAKSFREALLSTKCESPTNTAFVPPAWSRQASDATSPTKPANLHAQRIGPDFAQLKIPAFEPICAYPFALQWELQRVLQAHQTGTEAEGILKSITDHIHAPMTLQSLYTAGSQLGIKFEHSFATNCPPRLRRITLKSRLEWSHARTGPVFDLLLDEPGNNDRTCDLQRKFGVDNVLYITMPSWQQGHRPETHKEKDIEKRFRAAFSTPPRFLGRSWILFNIKENVKQKISKDNLPHDTAWRLILVSTHAYSASQIYQYVYDRDESMEMLASKAYSRSDLHVSQTMPFETKLDDISYAVPDMLATDDPDEDRFLDPEFASEPSRTACGEVVMNDGVSEMSAWLSAFIADKLGHPRDRIAVQGRIAGAKGIWVASSDPRMVRLGEKPSGPHIKISKSQIKVLRTSLAKCDPHYLTFNLLRTNSYARPSVLHMGFLPILLDRGVSRDDILQLVRNRKEQELERVMQSLQEGPVALHRWIYNNARSAEPSSSAGRADNAGFPLRSENKMMRMLEAGFDARENKYLADLLESIIKRSLKLEEKRFRLPLSQSTTLLGIVDPSGSLQPGEIHVNFQGMKDLDSDTTCYNLNGLDVLVARNPALARWDIHKVRCVCKTELAYLTDVVVFPARGRYPLAAKLQGGDYDGDTFWLCWDPLLVSSFVNAPALDPPSQAQMGVRVKTKRLRDYVKDADSDEQWCSWGCEMALSRMRPNLLPTVSLAHERLIYHQGTISSPEALALVHLHDYLIDSDKQGYEFAVSDWLEFKQKWQIPGSIPEPAYFAKTRPKSKEAEPTSYPKHWVPVERNIIDDVFRLLAEVHAEFKDRLRARLLCAQPKDKDLSRCYEEQKASADGEVTPRAKAPIVKNLAHLKSALGDFREYYKAHAPHGSQPEKQWMHLREMYQAIQPLDADDPVIRGWLWKQGNSLTIWEKLKASAFATLHMDTTQPGNLVFNVAGRELCEIKAHEPGKWSGKTPCIMSMEVYRNLKPSRPPKACSLNTHAQVFDSFNSAIEEPEDPWDMTEDDEEAEDAWINL